MNKNYHFYLSVFKPNRISVVLIPAFAILLLLFMVSIINGQGLISFKANASNTGVTFGKGPFCDGNGLCSISDDNDRNSNLYPCVVYKTKQGAIQLEIEKSAITGTDIEAQLIDGWFDQEEQLIIGPDVLSPIGVPDTIAVGSYQVITNNHQYLIDFSTIQNDDR